jgi:hypothetical protein
VAILAGELKIFAKTVVKLVFLRHNGGLRFSKSAGICPN